jgi:hypothetical protein
MAYSPFCAVPSAATANQSDEYRLTQLPGSDCRRDVRIPNRAVWRAPNASVNAGQGKTYFVEHVPGCDPSRVWDADKPARWIASERGSQFPKAAVSATTRT